MYPLLELGPLRLATGGLLLLMAALLFHWLLMRSARWLGGAALAEQADACFLPTLLGAILGGRLWYGLAHFDTFGPSPLLFLELRVGDLVWPGALLGGALAGMLWARQRRRAPLPALADSAALALPLPQALASLGLLLSGEAFGRPAVIPWSIELLGTMRHPTQLYYALAALLSAVVLWRSALRLPAQGTLAAAGLALQGLAMLLIEPLRASPALLPGGIHLVQLFGLALILGAMLWARRHAAAEPSQALVLE
jgi:phosphatidylglycerol:prolipoprotein diacylglycerol transferase